MLSESSCIPGLETMITVRPGSHVHRLIDEHHELSMILDRLEANASEAMAKGIRAIRLSAEGYSHAEIGSILGESDKCVAARISRTRKYLRSHPDLAAF